MTAEDLTEEQRSELVSAGRTAVGDELRSLCYFTESTIEQLYLRDDLVRSADLVGFAENERLGFRTQQTYAQTQLGDYRFTIRVFEHGYLTRVIVGDHGAFITTDEMKIERFSETAESVEEILAEFR